MKNKPYRIAFISPYAPNLIRVRPYNFIKTLAEMGHKITLFVLVANEAEAAALTDLEGLVENITPVPFPRWRPLLNIGRALFDPSPLQFMYSRSPQLAEKLRQQVTPEHFDVAHIEHLRGAIFHRAIATVPVVYDAVDSISMLWEKTRKQATRPQSRLMAQLDLKRTQRFEAQAGEIFDQIIITSAEDLTMFSKLAGKQLDNLTVIPNGVDLDYFTPPTESAREADIIVFTGKMSYHANIAAVLFLAREIMPLVWRRKPDVKLNIVGKDPVSQITALAEYKNITVTGEVPSMVPYLQQASAAVAPLKYAVGIQNKVLEAMACGAPVIASSQIQHAVAAKTGEDFLAAESPAEFAQAILQVLANKALAEKLSVCGRRFVETRHSWEASGRLLVQVYEQAMQA